MTQEQEILNKSEALFMKYGIKSITMDDLARQLGISKKTIYQYFENKKDLVNKVMVAHMEREMEDTGVIVQNADNAIDEMLKIARYVIAQLRKLSPTALYDIKKYYRKEWALFEQFNATYIFQCILTNLERGQKEGLYRTDLNKDIIAKLYVGKTNIVVDEDLFPLAEYKRDELYNEFIHYHIRGIASPKGLEVFETLFTEMNT